MKALKQYWDSFRPEAKKKLIVVIAVFVVVAGSMIGYSATRGDRPKNEVKKEAPKQDLALLDNKNVLDKSIFNQTQEKIGKIDELQKQLADLQGQINTKNDGAKADGKQDKQDVIDQLEAIKQGKGGAPAGAPVKSAGQKTSLPPGTPPLPPQQGGYSVPPPPGGMPPMPAAAYQPPKPELIGDIEVVSQRNERSDAKQNADAKKKDGSLTVYLPPSFMEATLLSGIDAPVVEQGKGQPLPVLIRIKDLAVLPNAVKANLKGCFVIGEGEGRLSDERAHIRLVTLSCLSKNGTAVIDQHLKGFVTDSDGKVGLRGTIVSKMGANIARSMIAGLFQGIGDATRQSSYTSSVSALGTTQVIDSNQIVRAGVGTGISTAAHEIQKFYLELAKASLPVVEIGATRNVTIVVQEGVDLEIKEKENACLGGRSCKR